jgi:hypothetical protein
MQLLSNNFLPSTLEAFTMIFRFALLAISSICIFSQRPVQAEIITSGTATIQYDASLLVNTTGLTPVWFYGAGNGASTATQAQILALQGGGASLPAAASYSLSHDVNVGSISNPTGRARQDTNADLSPTSPLTTWSATERIGIDGVTVFSVGQAGLVTGDFSLLYSSSANRISLFNNFQIPVEAFRVNNPTFTSTANGFTIEGTLRTGDFFPLNGIAADQNIGTFSLNAITAVPEPSSVLLVSLAAVGFAYRIRKRFAPVAR